MIRRVLTGAGAVLAAALIWTFLWPAAFGGQATWLVVSSDAMAPYWQPGDLVIAREHPDYTDGQLVVRQAESGPILTSAGEPAAPDTILGAPWLHVSGLGAALLATLGTVTHPAFLGGALLLLGFMFALRRRKRAGVAVSEPAAAPEADQGELALAR